MTPGKHTKEERFLQELVAISQGDTECLINPYVVGSYTPKQREVMLHALARANLIIKHDLMIAVSERGQQVAASL